MKALVIIPTYNEYENLRPIITRVRASVPDADVLVVDDNSPDGTGELADTIAQEDPHAHVLHRGGKEGLGRAYLDAFAWALQRDYTHVVEMDADGSHKPEQLPLLLERAAMSDHPDLVIGSRYVPGGELEGWPKSRELLSRAGNLYIKLWLGLPASDVTAGYRVYRTDMLRRLDFTAIESRGYFFQTDMTDKVVAAGGHIAEMPISFAQRTAGESKLSGSIFAESFEHVTRLGIQRRAAQLMHAAANSLAQIKEKFD